MPWPALKKLRSSAGAGCCAKANFPSSATSPNRALAEVRADKALIGTRAISLEDGLTSDYLPETMDRPGHPEKPAARS